MKIIRKNTNEVMDKNIYYKVEVEYSRYNDTLTIEHSTFSWGHGNETDDEIYFDSRCDRTIFKTKTKSNIPDNIEDLLLERLFNGLIESINKKQKDIEDINYYIEQDKNILNKNIFKKYNRKLKLNSL
ncbi:hypothetical protein M0Q50_07365 [bacterium]|jgi:hypothetical protein|nr:hypothetical protein [bacterium]